MNFSWSTIATIALCCALPVFAQQGAGIADASQQQPLIKQKAGEAVRNTEQVRHTASALRSLTMSLVDIPGGSFRMGDLRGTGHGDEKPVHTVNIRAFRLMKHEVTYQQYDAFSKATFREPRPDDDWLSGYHWGRGDHPVVGVSFHNAQAFAEWVSKQTGRRFRLPTEAEWEYAARAGTETDYPWGNDYKAAQANTGYDKKKPTLVGSYPPNAWRLHDMSGNVFEWTADCWNGTYEGAPTDGSSWQTGDCASRVVRGGSWMHNFSWSRVSFRIQLELRHESVGLGFRLVEEP
jgi:formylglycine-generating enzyme required for sulfatase activity